MKQDKKPDEQQPQDKESRDKIKYTDDGSSKPDAAGTDPNRYKDTFTDSSEPKDSGNDNEYNQKPKNHTTTNERLMNPDRGEN